MPCNFTWVSTTQFRNEYVSLKKDYPSCEQDICDEFRGLSFEDVFAKNYALSNSGIAKVIKVRVANSRGNKGKSGGFRILILAHTERNHVCFIAVFAKTGAQGKQNIERAETKQAIDVYQGEYLSQTLKIHCSNQDLVSI